jgi:hypothetical protein
MSKNKRFSEQVNLWKDAGKRCPPRHAGIAPHGRREDGLVVVLTFFDYTGHLTAKRQTRCTATI